MIRYLQPSPIGLMVLSVEGQRVVAVNFVDSEHQPIAMEALSRTADADDHAIVRMASQQLLDYFSRRRQTFSLPLAPAGTAFQQAVWREIAAVPYGATISYGELARRLGSPRMARAVGRAAGANPWQVVVPCHRVVGAGGKLTGYRAGVERKRCLLELEAGAPEQALSRHCG